MADVTLPARRGGVPKRLTALSNVQFLLSEGTLVAQALADGADWAGLRQAARSGQLFGPGRVNSQLTVLTAIRGRFADLPPSLLQPLTTGTLETRRALTLALVTRHKPLLRDFLAGVVVDHWRRLERRVTDADARAFLTHQAEQRPEVAAWSVATAQKTRSNLTRFLQDAGLLRELRPGEFEILPQFHTAAVRAQVRELDPALAPLLEALQ